MTLVEIIRKRHGRAGSNGAWRVERDESDPFVGQDFSLWHYATCMLRWRTSTRYGVELIDYSTGHGSVSDQGGMNTAFRTLGLPYRFDRDQRGGGPRITELRTHDCGHITDSSVETCWCEPRELSELDTNDHERDERAIEALAS